MDYHRCNLQNWENGVAPRYFINSKLNMSFWSLFRHSFSKVFQPVSCQIQISWCITRAAPLPLFFQTSGFRLDDAVVCVGEYFDPIKWIFGPFQSLFIGLHALEWIHLSVFIPIDSQHRNLRFLNDRYRIKKLVKRRCGWRKLFF